MASRFAKASHLLEKGFQLLAVGRSQFFYGETGVNENAVADGNVVDEVEADLHVRSARTGDGTALPVDGENTVRQGETHGNRSFP
jgi:hypothetical protein